MLCFILEAIRSGTYAPFFVENYVFLNKKNQWMIENKKRLFETANFTDSKARQIVNRP